MIERIAFIGIMACAIVVLLMMHDFAAILVASVALAFIAMWTLEEWR